MAVQREIAHWHAIEGNSAMAAQLFEQLFQEWRDRQLAVAREMFHAYCLGAENSYLRNSLGEARIYQQSALELAYILQDHSLIEAAEYLGMFIDLDARTSALLPWRRTDGFRTAGARRAPA
ncbi:MAG: hypothetical protein IPK16_17920 [Anaerolineales bacterium]|nr:hypothetical protein [Anaerolineales bacterium]